MRTKKKRKRKTTKRKNQSIKSHSLLRASRLTLIAKMMKKKMSHLPSNKSLKARMIKL
jgi:hypothetical protein